MNEQNADAILNDSNTGRTDLAQTTFVMACMKFFGKKPNQSSVEFAKEIKELQGEDREYFIREFRSVGFDATKTA